MTIEAVKLDSQTWEVFIDGVQGGQYPTAAAAKSAAKRRLPASSPRLNWTPITDDKWTAKV